MSSKDRRVICLWSLTVVGFVLLLIPLLEVFVIATTFAVAFGWEANAAFFAGGPLALLNLVLARRQPKIKRVVLANSVLVFLFAGIWVFILAALVTSKL